MKRIFQGKTITQYFNGLVFLTIIVVLGGCSDPLSPTEKLETIFASTENCITPCWEGITPGQSTENDFLELVNSMSSNKFEDVKRSDLIPKGIRYIWYDRAIFLAGSLEIYDSTVAFISFQSKEEFTIGTILEHLGSPETYAASFSPSEAYVLDLYMFYENSGIVVNMRSIPFDAPSTAFQPTCEVELVADMFIREIFLLEPGSTKEIMSRLSRELYNLEGFKTWSGLGTIKLTSCPN